MWTQELAQSYTSLAHLKAANLVSSEEAERLTKIGARFKVRITPYYASLMSSDSQCPIRLQAIPALGEDDPLLPEWAIALSQEIYQRNEPWHPDAIGDVEHLAAPRITHRYGNRAILHLSSMCAVYCRFCFRKEHLNDQDRALYDGSLDPALHYLTENPIIRELILTGGDPLSLTDTALARLLEKLAHVSHLKVVRIHSRMAVTMPSRLTAELAELLGRDWPFQIHLVSHFNHPKEWTLEAKAGLKRIKRVGVALLNQNVLLRGINDSAETLQALYQGLYEASVLPFYLHHPDWTPGTFHFRVSIEQGQAIMRELRGHLPGAAIPHYVLDIPQGSGKASLLDTHVTPLFKFTEGSIQGAVYELTSPETRRGSRKTRYLDLFHWP